MYKTKVLFVDLENASFGDGDLRVGGAGGQSRTGYAGLFRAALYR